jgi:hypothetical protein
MSKIKYICIKEVIIYLDLQNIIDQDPTYMTFNVGDVIYLKFTYHGSFGKRYLVYFPDSGDVMGSLYGSDIDNFMELREYTINKVLKNRLKSKKGD